MNLTALPLADGLDGSLDRLIVEPFLAAQALPSVKNARIVDLGSGGGSPGIPLAAASDSTHLTLVESRARKAAFLRDVLRELAWPAANVLQVRMQELWSDQGLHGAADVISVRALAMQPADWLGVSRLLAENGRVAWFRSEAQPSEGTGPLVVRGSRPLTKPESSLLILGR